MQHNLLFERISDEDVSQKSFYQIKKKGKYRVFIPEIDKWIVCPNVNCVHQVLHANGRIFSVHDCYNYLATNRATAGKHLTRLSNAIIEKIAQPQVANETD